MEPADNVEHHRVENVVVNEDDSSGQEDTLPLDMLRFLPKHFSKHRHLFSHYFKALFAFRQGGVEVK